MGAERDSNDSISYIDSKGEERHHEKGLNLWWDFEDIEKTLSTDIDWEQRRYEISKSCINGILANEEMTHIAIDEGLKKGCRDIPTNIIEMAVAFSNALIVKLKKGSEE